MLYYLSFSFRCLQFLRFGFDLTFLFVLTITQVGTDLACLPAFASLFFLDASLTLAMLCSPDRYVAFPSLQLRQHLLDLLVVHSVPELAR
jgi:lysylphosphatidylglycerol synthetase-like protein (DUF2156 family)